MLEIKRRKGMPLLHLTVVSIALIFSSCHFSSSDSESKIHSLETDISSLHKDINTLKDQLIDLANKNSSLESKLKSVENNINTLGYKVR